MLAVWLFALIALFGACPDDRAGTVEGTLTLNKQPVALKFAYAHLHDNAEKLIDRPRELRILLVDREVPGDALYGIAFPPIWAMAMEGKVRGILIEMNPADPQSINVIQLEKPNKPGASLVNLSLSKTGAKLFKEWSLTPQRVKAAIDHEDEDSATRELPTVNFSVRFDAPVTHEPPVTADLKGTAAVNSPQIALLRARADAMIRGDLAAVRALNTKRANRRLDALPPEIMAQFKRMAKQEGPNQKKALAKVLRVVVRGDRAIVLITKNEWSTVVREDGKWKSDD